jgi:hypothetical protein
LGKLTVTRGLSKKTVKKIFEHHIQSIQLCCTKVSKGGSHLKGNAVFTLTIDSAGRATLVKAISMELKEKELERCIIQKLRQLVFPAPEGGKPVTVTVSLHIT